MTEMDNGPGRLANPHQMWSDVSDQVRHPRSSGVLAAEMTQAPLFSLSRGKVL
jgi:hypothetical protein